MGLVYQTVSAHETQAREYLSQGLYDEALQAYEASTLHSKVLKVFISLFGKFNSMLAFLGILFIATGILIRPSSLPVKKIKITKEFNWRT